VIQFGLPIFSSSGTFIAYLLESDLVQLSAMQKDEESDEPCS
jgi:hypothetical protein